MSKPDMVSHPPHYQSGTGLEVIDVIKAFTADLIGIEATDTGNIIKYICRWKHKNGLEDLKKARWYLDHLINIVENEKTAKDMAAQAIISESLKPNAENAKLIPCEYEGKPIHPYGDRSCMAEPGFKLCPGHMNCEKYEPCKTQVINYKNKEM
jgi:hypothetical protein